MKLINYLFIFIFLSFSPSLADNPTGFKAWKDIFKKTAIENNVSEKKGFASEDWWEGAGAWDHYCTSICTICTIYFSSKRAEEWQPFSLEQERYHRSAGVKTTDFFLKNSNNKNSKQNPKQKILCQQTKFQNLFL